MATLVWDQIGEKVVQFGVDHGVLYLQDKTVVVWNGLTNVEESTASELKSYFLDGVKYLEVLSPRDFSGKLKAFTYPDEFNLVNGMASISEGLDVYDQPSQSFNLSYRTKIGDDISGEKGYKIHILYNVIANPEPYSFNTLTDSANNPIEFSWILHGIPEKFNKIKPTVHISIDSTKTPPEILQMLENALYGTDVTNPSLPTLQEIAEYFGYLGALIIVDHGDGSWSAIDESDGYITMLNETIFQIDNADVTLIDSVTYQISSTNVD